MLKKLFIRIIIIIGILYALTIFFPENPIIKLIVDNYKSLLSLLIEKINSILK
jgi:hypothetical protein